MPTKSPVHPNKKDKFQGRSQLLETFELCQYALLAVGEDNLHDLITYDDIASKTNGSNIHL